MQKCPLAKTVKHIASQLDTNQHGIALNDPAMSLLVCGVNHRSEIVSVNLCHKLYLAFCWLSSARPAYNKVNESPTIPEHQFNTVKFDLELLRVCQHGEASLGDFEVLLARPRANTNATDDHVINNYRQAAKQIDQLSP